MGKKIGSERLGDLYQPGKKVRKRREWRGVKDTLYDYSRQKLRKISREDDIYENRYGI